MKRTCICTAVTFLLLTTASASGQDVTVGRGGDHTTISAALAAVGSGATITVTSGTYVESLSTNADNVTLRGDGGDVVVEGEGRVLDVSHDGFTVEGLVLDGGYGDTDAVRVRGDGFTLLNAEIRRSGRDCVDMGNVSDVTFEGSSIHHCLWSSGSNCSSDSCREDAHGITGGAVRNVRIVDTDIYSFSGDGIQFDPGRDDAGWSNVTVERSRIWLEPLPSAEGGYAAGVVPGENAVDTKTSNNVSAPAEFIVRDTTVWGFRGGLISNMAAFNMKENVQATFDGVTVFDSDIAFRLRGATGSRPRGAQVTIRNAVIYDCDRAVRYEDDLSTVTLHNSTFGADIGRAFQQAGAPDGAIDGGNVLVLGSLPDELTGGSNLAVDANAFADAAGGDYQLADDSSAIDVGEEITSVDRDRAGNIRPIGAGYDVGAFEHCEGASCAPAPPPPPPPPGTDGGIASDTDSGTTSGGDGGSPPTMMPPGGGDASGGCTVSPVQDAPWLPGLAVLVGLFVALRRRS